MSEKKENRPLEGVKLAQNKKIESTLPFRPVPVKTRQAARSLLGRVIGAFLKGKMTGHDARTMAYLLQTYCSIAKETEIDELMERLQKLEKHIKAREV